MGLQCFLLCQTTCVQPPEAQRCSDVFWSVSVPTFHLFQLWETGEITHCYLIKAPVEGDRKREVNMSPAICGVTQE